MLFELCPKGIQFSAGGEKAEKKDNMCIPTSAHNAGRRQKIPYSSFFFFLNKLSAYALKSRIAYLGKR